MAGIDFLKFRSCLLLACMAVVPLAAMFSHTIPRHWRLAAQRFARGEGFITAGSVARGGEIARVEKEERAVEPTAAAQLPVARVGDDASIVHTEVGRQLAALGAVAFECTAMPTGGLHRCSCRVPADPSGQLHRVFQSSNPDPVVALKNLLGQVQFWKHRLGTQLTAETLPSDGRTLRR